MEDVPRHPFTNEPSWRLMERVGMTKEPHFREALVPAEPGGSWIDAVLASEWPVHAAH